MIQDDLTALVQNLLSKQSNPHIIDDNIDYFKDKITTLFEIDHQLYDAQSDGDVVTKYLTEAYNTYIYEVANLIDEYEVRYHDLPERTLIMINDFTNQLFKSREPRIVDDAQRISILQQAQKILYCVGCDLKIALIKKYIELLSNYRKALNHLDCEHIKIENIGCVRYLSGKIKIIKDGYNVTKTSFKSFFDKDKNGIRYNFENISTISNLDEVLKSCRELLEETESNNGIYQKALISGGKPSAVAQTANVLLNYILPGILTILSVILWLKNHF